MASTYLSRTVGSGGSTTTGTISFWLKRGDTGATQHFYVNKNTSSNASFGFLFSSDTIYINQYDGTSPFNPANYQINLQTPSVFRDYNAWYHIVLIIDTSNGTEANRIRLYVNNVQQTLNKVGNQPTVTQNLNVPFLYNGGVSKIGSDYNGGTNFGGILTHYHLIDGTTYDASAFGETDATTGIWKPKTAPSVTYGTNGFFLKFANSGSMGTDSSGNGNNFTVNGNLTQTVDTPSNVFATLNPLWRSVYNPVFSNGNLTVATPAVSQYHNSISSLGVSSGKWYLEMKCNGTPNSANYFGIGNEDEIDNFSKVESVIGATTQGFSVRMLSGDKRTNGTNSSYGSAFTNGDIMMYAMDLDNGKVWFGKNGTWFASGDPAAGTNQAFSGLSGTFFIGGTVYNNGFSSVDFNFGNGYFGTTAVSSAQSPSDGIGIFEYAVPSGYKALCTKSINAQEYS